MQCHFWKLRRGWHWRYKSKNWRQFKKESETSDKEEKTSAKENAENDNTKTDSTDGEINTTPEDDTVYGKLSQPHGNNKIVNVDDTLYILNDNDEILQAEKSFSKLPLDKNLDKNFWMSI